MIVYFSLFGFLFLGTMLFDSKHDSGNPSYLRKKQYLLFVIFILFTLLIGLRYEIGADWFSYLFYYDMMGYLDFSDVLQLKDPAYQVINFISNRLDFGMVGVNLTCGCIFSYALIKLSSRQHDTFLSLLVAFPYLFIVVGMGYSRQAIAIGFFLLAIVKLYEENITGYVILLLIGAFFHKTAIIMVPIAFLITERNKGQKIFFGALFSACAIYLFFAKSIDNLAYAYLENDRYNSQGAFIRVVMSLIPGFFFIFYRKRFELPPIIFKLVFLLSCSSILLFVLLLLSPSLSTVIDRFALYVIPLQLLVLSNLNGLFSNNNKLVINIIICLYSFSILFVWLNYASHASAWVPYKISI